MSGTIILTSGTRGDVEPYLVLAAALRARGHRVCVAVHEAHRGLAGEAGVDARILPANPSELLAELEGDLSRSRDPFRRARALVSYHHRARGRYRELASGALQAMRGADTVIVGLPTFWLYPVARALGARVVACPLQPLTPSTAYPSALLGSVRAGRLLPNRWSHAAGMAAICLPWRRALDGWARVAIPGARFAALGPLRAMVGDRVPFVYGISPALFPRPEDWPAWHVLGGAWLTDRSGTPPEATLRMTEGFLSRAAAQGEAVLFVTLGSLEYRYGELLALLPHVVRELGCRAIVQTQGTTLPGSDRLLWVGGSLPHDWILARVSAVLHHGGAGTVARVARAGLPWVVALGAGDGAFWAAQGRKLGVSTPAIQPGAGVREITGSVGRALGPGYRARSRALGQLIRQEAGADHAAWLIEGALAGRW